MPRYIDAEAFEDYLREHYCEPCVLEGNDHNYVMCRACGLDDAIGSLEGAPTADVQDVKHGHWRHTTYKPNRSICSLCEWETDEIDSEWLKYCPFCGAKMDEKED